MSNKTYQTAVVALILTTMTFAGEQYTQAQIRDKIATYTKMETTGRTLKGVGWGLIGIGIVCIPIGVAIASNAGDESGEMGGVMFGGIGGGVGIGFGMVGAIAGGVLKGIGRTKRMEYEKKLSIRSTGNGLALTVEW